MVSKATMLCALLLAGLTATVTGAACPSNALLRADYVVDRKDKSWYLGLAHTESLEDTCDECLALPGCNFILYCNGTDG